MQMDPFLEWQRLTEHYGKMYDDELLDLAADSGDLTETAQQVLRDEMKRRRLEAPRTACNAPQAPVRPMAPIVDSINNLPVNGETTEEGDLPHEYTWKTELCECETSEEAWQICEMLRRAGIESWMEKPGSRWSVFNPRVLVAADQLDQAREVAARPIPQEIVDLSRMTEPEFELPACPNCGAGDPVLEGVDPVNIWQCEACGEQWTEPAGELQKEAEK
jgi:hypothetical protein